VKSKDGTKPRGGPPFLKVGHPWWFTGVDGGGGVDDFLELEACLLGPGGGLRAGCACFDLDDSGGVDLFDFAEFQVAFTGS
jgi:hypothetical protein